jgi:putative SOS response-associated peptidase YedK
VRWGLVPNYTKDLASSKSISTINARAETLLTSPTWRGPLHHHHCLVPADGLDEWKKLDPKTRQPYAFWLTGG